MSAGIKTYISRSVPVLETTVYTKLCFSWPLNSLQPTGDWWNKLQKTDKAQRIFLFQMKLKHQHFTVKMGLHIFTLLHVPLAWWLEGCSFTAIFDKLCKASQKKVICAVTRTLYTMSHQCFLQASWAQTAKIRAFKPRKWLVGFIKESVYENHEAINTKVTKWNTFTELVLCTVIKCSYNLIRTESLLVYLGFA